MSEYMVMSHIQGDRFGNFVVTEIPAILDEEAQKKFKQLLSDRREVPELRDIVFDNVMLVKVLEKRT